MGVISTIVISVLFNVLLPSGDQGSDLYLMYNTLTFQLGVSLELSGCTACYAKTESEVYYPKNNIEEHQKCGNLCLQNSYFACGL
jgi:hypothetical protein